MRNKAEWVKMTSFTNRWMNQRATALIHIEDVLQRWFFFDDGDHPWEFTCEQKWIQEWIIRE